MKRKTDRLKELNDMSEEAKKLKALMQAVMAGEQPNITMLKLKEEGERNDTEQEGQST